MMPSPDDLRYFLEAANKLNFSRAAEALGISQPSLSLAIKRVEAQLGEAVFSRSTRGVSLTPAGKLLLAQTRSLLDAWQGLRSRAQAAMHAMSGHYVLGCHPSVALYALPPFLPAVLAAFPHLEIELVHDLSRRIGEGVISSRIDMGIVVNPVPHPDLVVVKLANDDVTLWSAKPQTPLAEVYGGATLVLCPELAQTQHLLQQLRKGFLVPPRIIESGNLEVVAELTACGCGIGILPALVARRSARKLFRIHRAPFYRDEICLVIRRENRKIFALKQLMERIRAGFASEF